MDGRKRPHSREKHVTQGSNDVHKRGEGLHTGGPLGEERESESSEKGLAQDLIHMASGGSGHSSNSSMEHMVENMVVQQVSKDMRTKKGRKRLLFLAVVVLVVLAVRGGSGLLNFSGGSSGISADHALFASENTGAGNSQKSGNSTVLNTRVSAGARDKRTAIMGNGEDKVTVMVYMCGTDLESKYGMATADLTEMASAEISDKVNLIVYTGGCAQWKNNIVSSETNQIYQVKDGGLIALNKDMGSRPMTDPAVLTEFIRFGKDNFPANRYDLIFWDHGGGSVSGYGYDQKYAASGSMTLDKINSALKKSNCVFDFIGFDACLMATLENAFMLEPYADYLISSEETEPGVGWYYTNWLTALSKNTSMSTPEIGKQICDDFVEVCAQRTPSDQTTLSLVDLTELTGTLPGSFENFAKTTEKMIKSKNYHEVSNARSRAKEFAASSGIDQVDLVDLADGIDTKESQKLVKDLKNCVKYNRTSSNVHNAYGLSIYFPYGKLSSMDKIVSTYDKIGMDSEYTKCIRSFASLETSGQVIAGGTSSPIGSLLGNISGGSSSGSGSALNSNLVSQLLENFLSSGNYGKIAGLTGQNTAYYDNRSLDVEYLTENQFDTSNLVWKDEGDGPVLVLPEKDWDLIQDVELNVFLDDGGGFIDLGLDNTFEFDGDGNLKGSYDGTWMAINGHTVSYYMISQVTDGEDYTITGRVPVMLNDTLADLILVFDQDNPYGYVAGARIRYDEAETATQAKGLIEIQEGDKIDFLCDYYTYDEEFQDNYYLGDPFVVDKELEISNISLKNAHYTVAYRLTDIYHNYYWTPGI